MSPISFFEILSLKLISRICLVDFMATPDNASQDTLRKYATIVISIFAEITVCILVYNCKNDAGDNSRPDRDPRTLRYLLSLGCTPIIQFTCCTFTLILWFREWSDPLLWPTLIRWAFWLQRWTSLCKNVKKALRNNQSIL